MDVEKKKVVLTGIRPIMFDRYAGDNDTQLEDADKMYYLPDGKTLCMPSQNILSMLGSQNMECAAKIVFGKGYQTKAKACGGFLDIDPLFIPITRKGKPVQFKGKFDGKVLYVDHSVARIKKSAGVIVPNPKSRPVLTTPWELTFTLEMYPNDVLNWEQVIKLFEVGGMRVGLGTWRGRYGKFTCEFK